MKYEFLYREYQQCFEQLRFYDERQLSLLRYLFALVTAAVAGQFAVYKVVGDAGAQFFRCVAMLGALLLAATILVHIALVQNRLYFVFVARQINAIRRYLLAEESPSFRDNQLYTSTTFPAARFLSLHSYTLVCSAFLASLFCASIGYGLSNLAWGITSLWVVNIAFFAPGLALFWGGYFYLNGFSSKSADRVIGSR